MFDQNFLFMAFLMLCFAGLATMFYFMMRNVDELTRMIREDRNQMQTNLRALESSLNHLADLLSRLTATEHLPRGAASLQPEALRPRPAPGPLSDYGAMPGARPGAQAMPESLSNSGAIPRSETMFGSGAAGPAELRSAPAASLRMPGEADNGISISGAGPAQAYTPLSFSAKSDLDLNGAPLTPAAASAPSGRPAAPTPPAAPGAPATPAQPAPRAAASGASSLPNLSMDSPYVRRR